jgi:glycerate-2-kinase
MTSSFSAATNAPGGTHLDRILRAALDAAHAGHAVAAALRRDGDRIQIRDRGQVVPVGGVRVLAIGKAAPPMAEAALAALGDVVVDTLVVGKGESAESESGVRRISGDHPVPGPASFLAGAEVLRFCRATRPDQLLLVLLSGGASALVEAPVRGVEPRVLGAATATLLRSGASIRELNAFRRSFSRIKAGGLLRHVGAARVCTLAVSDVPGNDPALIGSGPTWVAPPRPADALAVVQRYESALEDAAALAAVVREPFLPGKPESEPEPEPCYMVIADVGTALRGAADAARACGYAVEIVSEAASGEAREAGREWARLALAAGDGRPRCLLAGGETTVTVSGGGRGGRNQEFVLAAAIELADADAVTVAAIGTDGEDGVTAVAGARCDGTTAPRAEELGLSPQRFLRSNDSFTFFTALGDVIDTGPTCTNVMDIHVALVGATHG